jgi:hypothetical protein
MVRRIYISVINFCQHESGIRNPESEVRILEFGDLHRMGRDWFIFLTESKNATKTYFAEDKAQTGRVNTWDGTMAALS